MSAEVVRAYIQGTHGSLPGIDYAAVGGLLSEHFELVQEEAWHGKPELLDHALPIWASIVDGQSTVRVHSIVEAGDGTVLAHWETGFDCREGAVWFGTDLSISGIKVRGFQVFASFTVRRGEIVRIVERSDAMVKKFGIDVPLAAIHAEQSLSSLVALRKQCGVLH